MIKIYKLSDFKKIISQRGIYKSIRPIKKGWYIFLFNSQKNDSNIEILIIILDVKLLGRQEILIF